MGLRETFYPEVRAGGFSRIDTTVQFYLRINSLLERSATVLDLGAGRGGGIVATVSEFRRGLMILRGKCHRVIGADVDAAVLENPYLDEAHVIKLGEPLPFPNESFDLIYADWTLEHVSDPTGFVTELERVLKPGGWFCARTPNALSYQGVATRVIPNRFHERLLGILQPKREARDIFDTHFKMNTLFALQRLFTSKKWDLVAYTWNGEPAYVGNSRLLWRLTQFLNWLSPAGFGTILLVFSQRR